MKSNTILYRWGLIAVLACSAITLSPSARAQTFNLSFESLPSAQGWTYITATQSNAFDPAPAVPESSIFSLAGGLLHQDSLGQGNLLAGYWLKNYADFTKSYTITLRARVLAQDNGDDHAGFSIFIHSDAWATGFGIAAGDFPTSDFHDYRFEGNPDGSATLYIDEVLVSSGAGNSSPLRPDDRQYIFVGDGTPSGSNASGDIAGFTFTQDTAAVPEPATASLLCGVATLLGAALWRRPKSRRLA